MRPKITKTLCDIAGQWMAEGLVSEFHLYNHHDVHAYFRLRENGVTLHVQAYPGFSDEREIAANARVLDTERLEVIRRGGASIGNEHGAVIASSSYIGHAPYERFADELQERYEQLRASNLLPA